MRKTQKPKKKVKILVQFILNLLKFLYSGGADLIQASTSTLDLIFRKTIAAQKSAMESKKAQNSDIKKKRNSDCGALVEKNNWTRLEPIDPIDPISKTSLKPID